MSYPIDEIEGIGTVNTQKLAAANIATTGDLLEKCGSAKGRQETSDTTGLSTAVLLKWADMADLMRIEGIGRQFGELLKAAGVDTVKELRTRNANNLAETLAETNAQKNLTNALPSASQVQQWIEKANNTEPMITH